MSFTNPTDGNWVGHSVQVNAASALSPSSYDARYDLTVTINQAMDNSFNKLFNTQADMDTLLAAVLAFVSASSLTLGGAPFSSTWALGPPGATFQEWTAGETY